MIDKDDTIENLDEQIKKLEKKDENLFDAGENEEEATKVFNNVENTDTKIFNGEDTPVVIKKLNDEDTKVEEKIEILEEDIEEKDNSKEIKQDNKNKKNKIVIIILIISIILVGGFCVFFLHKNINKEDKAIVLDDKELTAEERAEVIKNYGEALEGVIGVYYSKQSVILEYADAVGLIEFEETVKCSVHEIYKDGKVYLNKCSVNGIKSDASYGKKQEIETGDDILEVYVNKTSKVATLSKPKNTALYDTYIVHCNGAYSDPVLLSGSSDYVFYFDSEYNIHMKNYKTDEKALPNLNYSQIMPIGISTNNYDATYVAVCVNEYWGIYNLDNNSQVISPMYSWLVSANSNGVGVYNSIDALTDNLIIASNGDTYGVINYTNNKTIIPFDYTRLNKSGNYIWAMDEDGVGYIYDTSGNKYLTEEYDSLYGMVDGNYVLVRQGDDVKLVQINGKVLYNYGKIDNIGDINFSLTYNDGPLFQFYNTSDSENCIEVIYDPSTKEGATKTNMCGGIAKPILYLYPEEETSVTVGFEHPEYLETTYPKFTGKWQIKADSNGNLVDFNGKRYYALYWDEKKVHEVDFSEGFYVEKDDAIEFLENKLSYIGLSDYERNEFIMYWLPILEKNEKSLVYFELTEERESYNKINISPKPDSLLRVVIHVKKVDKKITIKKQKLVKVQRKGFVAVEWGGTTY